MAAELLPLTFGLTITVLLALIFRVGGMGKETHPLVANQHIALAGCLFASLFVPAAYSSLLILLGLLIFFWADRARGRQKTRSSDHR